MGLTSGIVSGAIQGLYGVGKDIANAPKLRRANADLENYANSFKPNQSILNYYDEALKKYGDGNPYNSISYNNATQKNYRNFGAGLNTLQGYRQAGTGVARLLQIKNDSDAKAAAAAEQAQSQNLSQLGTAAERKTAEEQKKFDMLYNLKAMKAGQLAGVQNAATQNIFQGASTIAASGSGDNSYGGGNRTSYPYTRAGGNRLAGSILSSTMGG